MSTYKQLQRKNTVASSSIVPTYSALRPSRSLASRPTPTSEPDHPVSQAQLDHAARFGQSLDRISILPPAIRAAELNKAEQAGAIATMQQASSTSVSAPSTQRSPEAIHTEEYANSGHTPRFEYSFATIPLFPAVQREAVLPSPLQGESQLGLRIQAARSSGHSLDKQVQQRLEQGLGTDLSGIRVHADSEADRLSQSVSALAFTTGPDVFFRSGAYRPSSSEGLHLLAHEVTHVVQQAAGPVSGRPMAGGVSVSNPGDRFEQAAEASATQITAGTSIQRATTNSADKLYQSLSVRSFTPSLASPYKLGNSLGQRQVVIQRFTTSYIPDPSPDPYTGAAHIEARIGGVSGWPGGEEPTGGIPKVIDNIGSPIKGRYVAGHLMNEEIAGKANNANLTVLTVKANNLHKGYENNLKKIGYYADFIEKQDLSLSKKYGDKAYEHGADYEVTVNPPKPDRTENFPDEKLLVSGLAITITPIRRKIGSTGAVEPWNEMKNLEVNKETVPNVPPYPLPPGAAPAKPKPKPKSILEGDDFDYSEYGSGYNPIKTSKSGRNIKPKPY